MQNITNLDICIHKAMNGRFEQKLKHHKNNMHRRGKIKNHKRRTKHLTFSLNLYSISEYISIHAHETQTQQRKEKKTHTSDEINCKEEKKKS